MANDFDNELYKLKLLEEFARLGARLARSKIESETLRQELFVELRPASAEVVLGVPHYWALYYHDGRGPIRAKPGKWLVYFKDPQNDPRIAGGYPVRSSDIVRLTRAQFYDALSKGELIVTKSVGPAAPHPFFTKGMATLQSEMGAFPSNLLGQMLLAAVPSETDKVEIRLK